MQNLRRDVNAFEYSRGIFETKNKMNEVLHLVFLSDLWIPLCDKLSTCYFLIAVRERKYSSIYVRQAMYYQFFTEN